MFSGDLLFAGSIGRTDLPGGDHATMLDSLARVCLTLPDETAGAARAWARDDHRRGTRQSTRSWPACGRPRAGQDGSAPPTRATGL